MLGLKQILGGDLPGLWRAFQAPLTGGAVSLVLVILARWRGGTALAILAGGAGILVAWVLLAGGVGAAMAPGVAMGAASGARDMTARLPLLALAALLLALVTAWLAPVRGRLACLVLSAAGAGWWLAGAPHSMGELAKVALLAIGLMAWHGAAGWHLARGTPGRLVLAAWTLVAALWATQAPAVWLLLALAPALASLLLLLLATSELVLLPVVIALAASMAATLVAGGRVPRGLGGLDVAVAAPVIALLLAPRLRFAAILAGPVAGAIAVVIAWIAQRLLG